MEEPYYAARARVVAEFERHYLTQLLTHSRGNMSHAARVAGVDRTTLYRLLARHGLDRRVLTSAQSHTQTGSGSTNDNGIQRGTDLADGSRQGAGG